MRYKPSGLYDPKFDSTRCSESVVDERGSIHQCARKAVKDGVCKQHHPEAVAARAKKSQDAYDAKWKKFAETRGEQERAVRMKERADVLAWLRQHSHFWKKSERMAAADCIERGEHEGAADRSRTR